MEVSVFDESAWLREGSWIDGRYRILKHVKAGGMGAVYQVEDSKMGNRVMALKQMLDSFSDSSERRDSIDRFLSEIQVLTDLRHPNIPQVTDHFIQDKSFFFVMEFIEGRDMSSFLKAEGAPGLDPNLVAKVAVEVAEALKHIHSLEVPFAHRDIKPSNILVRERDQRIMLIDFGIARVNNPQEGFWIGTPGYAPPEQQYGKPELISDIYALGASMHELLSGKRPGDFNFAPFADFGVEVPPVLEQIIVDALAWNPDERIQSAHILQERLIGFLGYNPLSGAGDAFHFSSAVGAYKSQVLDPLLYEVIQRYGNECHTRFLPKNLDYLVLTLACPMPFELIIKKNEETMTVDFYEKEGLLSQIKLASIDPSDLSPEATGNVVERFISDYENFKSGGWQVV